MSLVLILGIIADALALRWVVRRDRVARAASRLGTIGEDVRRLPSPRGSHMARAWASLNKAQEQLLMLGDDRRELQRRIDALHAHLWGP